MPEPKYIRQTTKIQLEQQNETKHTNFHTTITYKNCGLPEIQATRKPNNPIINY